MTDIQRRQDWHLTSTGVGLDFSEHQAFPPPHVRSTLSNPLPVCLQTRDEVSAFDELVNAYETTTGSTHNKKYCGGVLSHPSHPIAPPHYKVHYNKDLWEKLKLRAWRTPLSMGYQDSEMKAQFTGQPCLPTNTNFHAGPQPFSLADHHGTGPSQALVATTENKAVAGIPYYIRDQGVLNQTDIYATTTKRDFRTYTRKELEGYPKKDILTYWESEDYPKAWGHGLKQNPLSKESNPSLRRPGPMRDAIQFPIGTKLPRIPPRAPAVPHRGLCTLAQETYQPPLDVKQSRDRFCALETPWSLPHQGPLPAIMAVPKMYETEYETYGSARPITV
ncbi:stabilizer of axonemal microtubules 3 [Ambystoma mexicanum]|uniref:stabilizer of axonemal microtubules 3 n=1 Tax=Ambystoma mexicanum TaxID=8296 RepID=UPI0037E95E09